MINEVHRSIIPVLTLEVKPMEFDMELVATKLGWVNPSSGELVKSVRGLSGAREWDKATNEFNPPLEKAKKPEPTKRSGGRKKKED